MLARQGRARHGIAARPKPVAPMKPSSPPNAPVFPPAEAVVRGWRRLCEPRAPMAGSWVWDRQAEHPFHSFSIDADHRSVPSWHYAGERVFLATGAVRNFVDETEPGRPRPGMAQSGASTPRLCQTAPIRIIVVRYPRAIRSSSFSIARSAWWHSPVWRKSA